MKFGKLADVNNVNFQLPPEAVEKPAFWQSSPQNEARLYIGGTGWGMKEWVGLLYKAGSKPPDFLREYAQQFNTIELNTTHYRLPDAARIESWVSDTPSDFRFCPKVLQALSHSRDLGINHPLFQPFWDAVFSFGDRLGWSFMQLPPYFDVSRLLVLEQLLAQLPIGLPLAIEFRHESWFQGQALEQIAPLLERQRIGLVLTDVAGRRDVLHMRLTVPVVLLRFVGNVHPTDFQRANDWIKRLDHWRKHGLKEVYLFVHQPEPEAVPPLAVHFCERISELSHWQTRCLKPIPQSTQGSLF